MNTSPASGSLDTGPLVSVIIPSFRMGAFIGDALASIASQQYTAWEVIVLDDHGPEDGTTAMVQAFADAWPGKRVVLSRHAENRGVSAARNTGIGLALGEFLAFLDPDDAWFPDHLERSMELFHRDAALDVTTGPVEVHAHRAGGVVTWKKPKEDWYFRMFPNSLAVQNFIQPSATLVRKSAILDVGVFDEDPEIQHIEDYDLWVRMIEAGRKFGFVKHPTSIYTIHEKGATANLRRMKVLHHNISLKHLGYFKRSSFALHQRSIEEVDHILGRLDGLERKMSGPVFRIAIKMDAILRKIKEYIRS